jgi:hypothetical protein
MNETAIIAKKLALELVQRRLPTVENELSKILREQADNGSYIITFGEEIENDWVVRTYCSPECQSSNKMVSIIGDFWAEPLIFQEKNIVMAIFKEFFIRAMYRKNIYPSASQSRIYALQYRVAVV